MAEYVEGIRIPETGDFRTWSYGGRTTTLLSGDRHEKLLTGFNGDRELAETCADIWRSKDFTGWPRGPASFFHQEFSTPSIPWSVNQPLSRYFRGGWMESFERGFCRGPLSYYDLKRAYMWAGDQDLPTRVRPFRYGDENFLAVMEIRGAPSGVPREFRSGRALVTPEDIEVYDLWGEILWGVSWKSEDTTRAHIDALQKIDYLPPRATKLMQQSYWGRWAQTDRVVATTWQDGEKNTERQLKNPSLNLVWATLILHRVKRRVYRATISDAVLVCVDAVLRRSPLEVGTSPGDWTLKDRLDGGAIVDAPGVWTRAPAPEDRSRWDRHAGYESRAERARKRPARKLEYLRRKGYRIDTLRDLEALRGDPMRPMSRALPSTLRLDRLEELRREDHVDEADEELARLELDSALGMV